jgi:DNA-binding NarL/FixJ family response regulator
MTNILIGEDNYRIRKILRGILAQKSDWRICGEAHDGQDAVRLAKLSCPDLALLDISMPLMNGFDAAKLIIASCPNAIVITESFLESAQMMDKLKTAGVRGFIPKMELVTELVPAIEAVLSGGTWFRPDDGNSIGTTPQ